MSDPILLKMTLLEEVRCFEVSLPKVKCNWDSVRTHRFDLAYAEYLKHRNGSVILLSNAVRDLRNIFEGL